MTINPNSSDNRRGSIARSVSVAAEGSPYIASLLPVGSRDSGSSPAGSSRSSGGQTRETKPLALTSPRRNFDVEDIVDYCPCGGPIYAESIGIGDDSLCVPCRRDEKRGRL